MSASTKPIQSALFISDGHLESDMPKGMPLQRPTGIARLLRSRPVLATFDWTAVPFFNTFTRVHVNLRPKLTIAEFDTGAGSLFKALSNSSLIVYGGDFGNASISALNRDRLMQPDVKERLFKFSQNTEVPIVFLPGNADALTDEQMASLLREFSKIHSVSNEKLGSANNLIYNQTTGNFTFRSDDVLIVGLNSLGPGELGHPDNVNESYLKAQLDLLGQEVPVVIYTHHNPFPVLPWYFMKFLKEGMPVQTYLVDLMKEHVQKTGMPASIICGHAHEEYHQTIEGVDLICNPPFSFKRNHLGTTTTVVSDSCSEPKDGIFDRRFTHEHTKLAI